SYTRRAIRSQEHDAQRAQAFREGVHERFNVLNGRIETTEKKATGPDAEEATHLAWRHAMNSARLDKARRLGEVLGGTLANDSPNWAEAADFIRTLESLNEADIEGLRILWRVQKQAFREMTSQQRGMSTDANDYTTIWTGVLDRATRAGVSKDDWYSRCARLSGFGLTVLVYPNQSQQGPDAICFRLTGRAVRLLQLLGVNTDPGVYPRWKYHATEEARTVQDEDEERRLGPGWADTPNPFLK